MNYCNVRSNEKHFKMLFEIRGTVIKLIKKKKKRMEWFGSYLLQCNARGLGRGLFKLYMFTAFAVKHLWCKNNNKRKRKIFSKKYL